MLTDDEIICAQAEKLSGERGEKSGFIHREQPLRMELFSVDQRRERGRALGQEHLCEPRMESDDRLLIRLRENEEELRSVHRLLVDEVNNHHAIAPVAEWIVDNFYVLEEQASLCRRHLPKKYLEELPGLLVRSKEGMPRVYDLAEHIVAYGDSRLETADISVVVTAYQDIVSLKLGELWAIPIMLRLALMENVRRMAIMVGKCQRDRESARKWAERLGRVAEEEPKDLVLVTADMARSMPNLSNSFVAEFKRVLQGRGSAMRIPLGWLEQSLNERNSSVDQALAGENHEQAELEVSMRNCITSLRTLNVTDWNEFVETLSKVERTLRKDPGDVYGKMDFATRDMYRRAVERLAGKTKREEVDVAAASLGLAREAVVVAGARSPEAHVGYYLVGQGESELARTVGASKGIGDYVCDGCSRCALLLYLGSIGALTAVLSYFAFKIIQAGGVGGWMLAALTVLFVLAAGHLAVGLVNLVVTQLLRPRPLARLDYHKGIPSEMRTLVVTPVLMTSEKNVGEMLRNLEVQYLNNRGQNIHFGLLTDFADADNRVEPTDARLLNLCRLGIIRLNDKYHDDAGDNFFLFHRQRTWNQGEKKWMGRERKRGKLEDLNRFLRGADPDVFDCVEGATHMLSNVRYVITLDADTMMARESAHKMVGAMAHPLNQPRYDHALGRVMAGHGILQPRVDATITGANRSWFARMNSGDAGIDPYTMASSDVYQDLFDEGSFIGKGIYEVETFDRALANRFPDNTILSHDLIEGCVVRSGLIADVKLYEDPPNTYLMEMKRRHRWVRGDWQIAGYIFGQPAGGGLPLSMLSRWKIFDNLRRSLTSIALFLLLVLGSVVVKQPGLFLLLATAVVLGSVAAAGICALFRKSRDKTLAQHLHTSLFLTMREAAQVLFRVVCLPFEAYVNADAIVRSLWRKIVSRKKLLQWNPFDNKQNPDLTRLLPVVARMWICPVAALAVAGLMAWTNPAVLPYAAPFLVAWFFAPLVASLLSRRRRPKVETLTDKQRQFMRGIARRTWSFFETFVAEDDNWLPPDNFQEEPGPRIAHRTSPTNIGLSLLANLSAHDFGYIGTGQLIDRSEKTLDTMRKLERYRGHYFNWYETRTLEVLRPAYISTVDSANLAAHALVLASGLRELTAAPVVSGNVFSGFVDTLVLAQRKLGRISKAGLDLSSTAKRFRETMNNPPDNPSDYLDTLKRLEAKAQELNAKYPPTLFDKGNDANWLAALAKQIQDAINEANDMMPWVAWITGHPKWAELDSLKRIPTLFESAALADKVAEEAGKIGDGRVVPDDLAGFLSQAVDKSRRRLGVLQQLLVDCDDVAAIDFEFLYNRSNKMLRIGFNVDEHRGDNGYYDLLASEARLATYLGIAQNKLPQESWFALGRTLTLSGGRPLLLSWSGSMFEYLMPLLIMPGYEGTLLEETYKSCVQVQIDYGNDAGISWGVSESGYCLFDSDMNYQYRAFGVPELGLRHTLVEDVVIAPYATALAAMVYPKKAAVNLGKMADAGFTGKYGFYEAVDFTPSRMERGQNKAIIKSHMSHHLGMSLVAFGQVLLNNPMHRRFNANPLLNAASMLLQEVAPAERAMYFHTSYSPEIRPQAEEGESGMRILSNPNAAHPEVQLLSNGRYHVMLTSAGGGYSRWNDLALTRWREDATKDDWGMFCYLRDSDTGEVWSTTHQPTRKAASSYEAVFLEGKAEYLRRDEDFDCRTEIVIAPDDDVEVRRLRIGNRTGEPRRLELTSYAEVALANPAADNSHPAFSKLFVQTSYVPERQAIVCARRPRSKGERFPSLFHMLAVRGANGGGVSYETDRLAFLGRGRDAGDPAALDGDSGPLSGGVGAVLDPVTAIRTDLVIEPGDTVVVDMITGVSEDPGALDSLMEKYQDERSADKAFDLAWSHGQFLLRQLGLNEEAAQRFCRLAGSIVYVNPAMRAEQGILIRNRKGQSGLWGYAISGDIPIVLARIADPAHLAFVDELIQAHSYWRKKGLAVDLLIWNEDQSGYRQNLHDQIVGIAGSVMEDANLEKPGGIFIRSMDRIPEDDRILMQSVARVVLNDGDGTIDEQLRKLAKAEMIASSTMVRPRPIAMRRDVDVPVEPGELEFANEYGGFSPDGKEYVVVTDGDAMPPLPWSNVIANDTFGCVVTEAGASYSWIENAHEYRLTPWQNDPVSDSAGEAIYIRDEESGDFWSPAPYPCRTGGRHVTRHGFGYSQFEHNAHGIASRMTIHVDKDVGVKFFILTLINNSRERRTLSVTGYVEWALGERREKTAAHIVTGIDTQTGAILAGNRYNTEFQDYAAFLDVDDPGRTVTGDRLEFIGRNGDLHSPFAMQRAHLSGRVGPGLDPCGAVQVRVTLGQGQEREVVIRLGAAENVEKAKELLLRFHGPKAAKKSLQAAKDAWEQRLGVLRVETPDKAFDFMVNGWLPYQTLSCRFWGRSAIYQSGGAFGFRDQLQDSLALIYAEPALVREHIVRSAGRQFRQGDVQHWWHPPAGRGVRTRCSDDYLWLPFVVERYMTITGDSGVLDENIRFIEGRGLREGEESYYDLPQESEEIASLYEHCKRSIENGLRFGIHGLPLMGSGDWNDGMDLVGIRGKGESVWLGFFLHVVLARFEAVARNRNDIAFADRCADEAKILADNIEKNSWDDSWYRRAYFDDGAPLGSMLNDECSIDSLAQSWSAISGVGDDQRVKTAMQALAEHLIDPENLTIKLFKPPFDKSDLNPGYIKGYVPGVRENGGQYTHGAIWAGIAYAHLGDRAMTWKVQQILNPINHALTKQGADTYKIEPYVIAADVYANQQHLGRGGWSWYTGSASWMYRFMLENILGFNLTPDGIRITPCIPKDWDGFRIRFQCKQSTYDIKVAQEEKTTSWIDRDSGDKRLLPIPIDGEAREHSVELHM